MTDDQFDDQLREAVEDYHRPPEVPREEMWARIEAARREQPAPSTTVRVYRLPRRVTWGVGLAATLAMGIAIGQHMRGPHADENAQPVAVAARPGATGPSTMASEPARAGTEPSGPSVAYRMATIEHLSHTEALLTTLRADARSGRSDPSVDGWARDLLGTTRMLLDSPAADDPQLGKLLNDLELVLAQIAALPSTHDRKAIDLIDDAVRQHAVLTRLRMAVPAGPIRTGT